MALRFPKKYYLIFAVMAICSAFLVYWSTSRIVAEEQEARFLRLENINRHAASELQDALNNYVTLISGLRAKTKFSNDFPSQQELFQFIKYQISDLNIDDSFVVSFVDTNHVFRYSFTKDQINPDGMVGAQMEDFVGQRGIKNLNSMMAKDAFHTFDPFNLVEGRVGLPLGFGVLDGRGKSLGYFSVVTDFKPIIDRVYDNTTLEEYVFKFSSSDRLIFDRERVYDGMKINNKKVDPEFYANFDIEDTEFRTTVVPFYNRNFHIGTAYKKPYVYSASLFVTSALFYLAILGFMLFVISQLYLYKRKNKLIAAQKHQLSELVATKNKFFSIIAHDLRSPLSTVINFLEVLKEEEFENKQTNQIFSQLEDSSKNSITLLDNLLKWSKVQTGQIIFKPEDIDILTITKDQLKVQQYLLDEKGLKVRLESSYRGSLKGDRNMIGTVIRNVLSNAIKFSHKQGIIVIELSKVGEYFSFSIEDNGIGIPQKYLKKLMDVTAVTSQLGTSNEKGSGLGLILCDQFIKAHNGKIEIESQVEKGTIVSFSLPISD
ncbi:MAG: two-component system sensor histidine kinase/response regulator [Flavobacteriales bacterium]|jgi:signal transduction histidine kinase